MKKHSIYLITCVSLLCLLAFSAFVYAKNPFPLGGPVEPESYPVKLYDYKGNLILETTSEDWIENQEEIQKKYKIGKYSPNKLIVNYLKEHGQIQKEQASIVGNVSQQKAEEVLQDMLKYGVIEKVQGKQNTFILTQNQLNKPTFQVIKKK